MNCECTWATKKATGLIHVDGQTKTEAKNKARKLLRDGYGIKARIVKMEVYGGRRGKSDLRKPALS